MIKEFKKIWNQDRSTKKDKALKELAYVYHTCDYQSIYRNYHVDTRDAKIKLDIFEDRNHSITMPVVEAMNKYQVLQTTLSMELLHDVELGLTKLRDYFKDVDFSDDEEGKSAKNFIANVKAMGDLVKSVKTLKDEVEKELTDNMQLRGRTQIAQRELPPEKRG